MQNRVSRITVSCRQVFTKSEAWRVKNYGKRALPCPVWNVCSSVCVFSKTCVLWWVASQCPKSKICIFKAINLGLLSFLVRLLLLNTGCHCFPPFCCNRPWSAALSTSTCWIALVKSNVYSHSTMWAYLWPLIPTRPCCEINATRPLAWERGRSLSAGACVWKVSENDKVVQFMNGCVQIKHQDFPISALVLR